jgi:hypothetical protein
VNGRGPRFAPPLVVLAVLGFVVFGGFLTADALSSPSGPAISVAGVVRVSPLSGWELAGRFQSPPGARLTRGSDSLDFIVSPIPGDADAQARWYVREFLEQEAVPGRLSVSRSFQSFRLPSGLAAVRFSYVGLFGKGQTAVEGQVTSVVSGAGIGVLFDGWAPQGFLQYSLGDIDTMIDSAEFS